MNRVESLIFRFSRMATFITLVPTVILSILNLLNTLFLEYKFGSWLPSWASLSARITGLSFIVALLLAITSNPKGKNSQ